MKKHNETRSKKNLVQKNGKDIRKAISFAMVFVMLFCISAYAETQIIIVTDTDIGKIEINANVTIEETEQNGIITIIKTIEFADNIEIIEEEIPEIIITTQDESIVYVSLITNIQNNKCIITLSRPNEQTQEEIINNSNIKLTDGSNEANTSSSKENLFNEIIPYTESIINKTDYKREIYIKEQELPPPHAYEGFIGNARGLFDMIFESIQSIFNWLVSPNVIVFFGLGIILSLSTIGILIARRFFWGI